MMTLAEAFVHGWQTKLQRIRNPDTPYRTLGIELPLIPDMYRSILAGEFFEDVVYRDQLDREVLFPLQNTTTDELQLTDRLSLKTFYKIWRLLQFFALTDIALFRKNTADAALVYNSLVRVITI